MNIKSIFKSQSLKNTVLISLFITLIYFALDRHSKFVYMLHLKGDDFLTRAVHKLVPAPSIVKDLVIVDINDESILNSRKRWPWDRGVFAEVMEKLSLCNPRVVVFDILFIGEGPEPGADLRLAEAIKNGKNVVLASSFDPSGKYVRPLQMLIGSATTIGFVDFLRDYDFVVRRTRPVMLSRNGKLIDFSLPLKAAALYRGIGPGNIFYDGKSLILKKPNPPQKGSSGHIRIPLLKSNEMHMNYFVEENQIRHVPFFRLLNDKYQRDFFEDKVVLIGITSPRAKDIYPSPLGMMPGVIMNAVAMLNIMDENFIKSIPFASSFMFFFMLSFAACLVTYWSGVIRREFYTAFLLVIYAGTCVFLALRNYRLDIMGGSIIIASGYISTSLYKYVGLVMENIVLKTAAITDKPTGLYVYKYFDLCLRNEFKKAQKEGGRLSLAIIDIDHFKELNNNYGDKAGDAVLKSTAKLIRDSCRRRDLVARYGGEEIVIILVDTGLEGAYICAKKIHKAISESLFSIPGGSTLRITASVGLATYPHHDINSKEHLVESADNALYKAKNTGRNKICIFGREESQA